MLATGNSDFAASSEFERFRPRSYVVADDPAFVPITDQKPFLAGNVRYILSLAQVFQLFALAGGILAFATALFWWGLHRRGDPQIPGRPFPAVAGLAFLIGLNFLMIEHSLVLTLFRRIYVYEDALTIAAISFLVLSGLGSLLAVCKLKFSFSVLAAVVIAIFFAFGDRLEALGLILGMAPVAMATGMFFPALFELAAKNPLAVFAFDAVGAGVAALAATFIPIVWGIDTFVTCSGAVFIVTVLADAWFHRRVDPNRSMQNTLPSNTLLHAVGCEESIHPS